MRISDKDIILIYDFIDHFCKQSGTTVKKLSKDSKLLLDLWEYLNSTWGTLSLKEITEYLAHATGVIVNHYNWSQFKSHIYVNKWLKTRPNVKMRDIRFCCYYISDLLESYREYAAEHGHPKLSSQYLISNLNMLGWTIKRNANSCAEYAFLARPPAALGVTIEEIY